MSFRIIRDDLTRVRADVIVNTANPEPVFGNGTDRAVYEAAGVEKLLDARKRIGRLNAGEAAVTEAFALPAQYIIHTVGPVWIDGKHGEFEKLASCYRSSLDLAKKLKCESIAFPLISTGVCGFPKADALRVALEQISLFLDDPDTEMEVILVVFNREAFEVSKTLQDRIDQYIDEKYAAEKHRQEHSGYTQERRRRWGVAPSSGETPDSATFGDAGHIAYQEALDLPVEEDASTEADYPMQSPHSRIDEPAAGNYSFSDRVEMAPSRPSMVPGKPNVLRDTLGFLREKLFSGKPSEQDLEEAVRNPGENFQQMLLRLIDERHLTDPEVYKKANIDRKLFSKIRCTPDYRPRKKTVLALAIALQLDLSETVDLLSRAELALSPGSRSDLIIEYCIENHIYNIYEINALLFEYDQPLLC